MSTAHSRRIRADLLIVLAAALFACAPARAKQSDKSQPININASAFAGSQDSGKITFTGNVQMDQGTFKADGAQATGYTDPNDTSQWQRVVLTGNPAHFQQTQDDGTLVHGQAQMLDYQVSTNTVILTGGASIVQQGKGEFHGERLVYNTDTGEIQGTAVAGGRVHITLQPRTQPAAAATRVKARAANAPATGSVPTSATAPAASSTRVPAAAPTGSAPAAAATSGQH